MLQDLAFGRLENEFRHVTPQKDDIVVCATGNTVLVQRDKYEALHLPTYGQIQQWSEKKDWNHWNEEKFQYVFRMQDVNYFIWMGEAGESGDPSYTYEGVRTFRQIPSKHVCFAAMTAWHLFNWYRSNRFCGRCGEQTVHDEHERMMRCPNCGNMIFPRISPAVIIAVTDGDRLLLSQYANRGYTRYALLAGFVEIGETAEETVAREVMEEVGLRVKNIRYYKSQPWGVDGNLSLGYFCDLDGEDDIHLDRNELALAQWFDRNDLPAKDDGISLTREMVRIFGEGKEPR